MSNEHKYNYRLDFRPLDVYFFGSERTFGNGDEANYYAKTRPYPQQTTILGVMRYLGYLTEGIRKAGIGESFAAEEGENQGRYGYIKAISPLFILDDKSGNSYVHGPLMNGAQSTTAPVAAGGTITRWRDGGHWETLYELPDFNPKQWYSQPLLSKGAKEKKLTDFVKTDTRTGITKQKDGQEKTDGFYKQEVGTLTEGAYFSVFLRLGGQASEIAPQQVISIGAEKCLFKVVLTKLKGSSRDNFKDEFPASIFSHCASASLVCAALLSDAYIEPGKIEVLPFVVAGTEDFRYLTTPLATTNFGRLSRYGGTTKSNPNSLRQSRKYNLLSRGSLLYAEDEATLRAMLDHPRWQTIGYNHYHLLPKIDK